MFTPPTSSPQPPANAEVSPRVSSFPSTMALLRSSVSFNRPFITLVQALRLFFTSLKSPWYSSVISSGMSPLEMRSTYSAVTFMGATRASSISLMLSISVSHSPSTPSTLILTARLPFLISSTTLVISARACCCIAAPALLPGLRFLPGAVSRVRVSAFICFLLLDWTDLLELPGPHRPRRPAGTARFHRRSGLCQCQGASSPTP